MSQEEICRACEQIFAKYLGGHRADVERAHIRGSAWLNFPRVLCEKWSYQNIVLMGDAAATAHFSIGSGTKLAMESAVVAWRTICIPSRPCRRRSPNTRTPAAPKCYGCRSAARNSMEWFEEVERYLHLDPVQFNYSLLTRSQRISHENLRAARQSLARGRGRLVPARGRRRRQYYRRPMFAPFTLRDMRLRTASSFRRWRNTRRSTAVRPTGTSCITPNAPRAAPAWSASK